MSEQLATDAQFSAAVAQVEKNTASLMPLWMDNWRTNLQRAAYGDSLDKLFEKPPSDRVIIVGRGPSLMKHNHLDLLTRYAYDGHIVASDGALPLLAEKGIAPYCSMSVDGSPLIAKWFDDPRTRKIGSRVKAVLPVTVHRKTAEAVEDVGGHIFWYVPILDSENTGKGITEMLQLQTYTVKNSTGLSKLSGSGNCLKEGTDVYTPNGPIPIEKLKVGDYVYSVDKPSTQIIAGVNGARQTKQVLESIVLRKVVRVIPQGLKQVFRLRTNTRSIQATAEHPMLIIKDRQMCWAQLQNVRPGDMIVLAKRMPESASPYDSISPDLMKFLGCFLGDGFYRLKKNHLGGEVSLALPEGETRDQYVRLMTSVFGRVPSIREYSIHLYSGGVARLIQELGFTGHSLTKRIPPWVFTLPNHLILSFLQGYADADGCERMAKSGYGGPLHTIGFEAANEVLIHQIRFLCIKVGWRVTNIYPRTKRNIAIFNGRDIYDYPNAKSYAFHVYPDSKKNYAGAYGVFFDEFNHARYLGVERVRSILPQGISRVFDIEVEGTHNFIADGIVVHNCGLGAIVLSAMILRAKEICMIGMDSSYRLDTPLEELHYHHTLLKALGYDNKAAAKLYRVYEHPLLGKSVCDPVFELYRLVYGTLAKQLKASGIRIINATSGGCLATPETEIVDFESYLRA